MIDPAFHARQRDSLRQSERRSCASRKSRDGKCNSTRHDAQTHAELSDRNGEYASRGASLSRPTTNLDLTTDTPTSLRGNLATGFFRQCRRLKPNASAAVASAFMRVLLGAMLEPLLNRFVSDHEAEPLRGVPVG